VTTKFRNVDFDESLPLSQWPSEAIMTMVERGDLLDWRRLAHEVNQDPWGPVSQSVEEVIAISNPYGIGILLREEISLARKRVEKRALTNFP